MKEIDNLPTSLSTLTLTLILLAFVRRSSKAVYARALEIKKKSDGETHFSVGHTLYNMACLHMDHGKRRRAAHFMRESLLIYESCFG